MLALEVEYLMGRTVATARSDRAAVEWPPHPARLYSALLATLHEAELSAERQSEAREVLAWLEALPAPALYADPPQAGNWGRTALNYWVPVNPTRKEVEDSRNTPAALLGEGLRLPRKRAERTFPAFAPVDPRVVFVWRQVDQAAARQRLPALDQLARELSYLGHSMSPVRAHCIEAPPQPNLIPVEQGPVALRVPGAGRLARLEACHAAGGKLQRRIEPPVGRVHAYAPVARGPAQPQPREGLFRIGAVYRRSQGERLPAEATTVVAESVRANLLRRAVQPPPAVISGHARDGKPSREPHLAVVPLPRVGDRHAEGELKGVAVLVPRLLGGAEHEAVDDALAALAVDPVFLGRLRTWCIERCAPAAEPSLPWTLRSEGWSRPAKAWATASPMVFGHHPRASAPHRNALAILSRSCRDLGLPEPVEVEFGPASRLLGAPPAGAYRAGLALRRFPHQLFAHVWLRFAEPVAGPIVLGAGRFFGLGLLRPLAPGSRP